MSILFVLLTFLLVISVTYFIKGRERAPQMVAVPASPPQPRILRQLGFEVPTGYFFHPGHTWALDEGRQNVRVGMDSFAANLLGQAERIEVTDLNRWVRQGQKLWTVTTDGTTVEMLSPVEGVLISVNTNVLKDPSLALKDPYKEGWLCVIKSPEAATNLKNLVQGTMVAPWMQGTLARLNAMTAGLNTAVAQDGGLPVTGLLPQLDPDLKRRLVREFFLT